MNQFSILSARALNSGATDAQTTYMASPAYRARTEFQGATGLVDRMAIQLYLLSRMALDVRRTVEMRERLSRGVVTLHFFGIANPTPFFELPVGSLELQQLKDSVEANLGGPLVSAEARVLKWRNNWKLLSKQSRRVDDIVGSLSDSLDWSDSATRQTNPERAAANSMANRAILEAKRTSLWSQRHARLAKLTHATAVGVTGWTELLADVSANVLQPT